MNNVGQDKYRPWFRVFYGFMIRNFNAPLLNGNEKWVRVLGGKNE